ncbi:MAG: helix-turn-helix domain-containing protein [Bacteroidota bacterium]
MNNTIELTTAKDKKVAGSNISILKELSEAIIKKNEAITLTEATSKVSFSIPVKAFVLLESILKAMAAGKAVTLMDIEAELSTQKAAEFLNVSRPHLTKLLKSGKIPFRKVGSHRRVKLRDIVVYQQNLERKQKKALDFLTSQAQELNLDYDDL